ncbi:hypothetical protein [Botrimarina sp.]|uniref:hypothetical protein n=1 Tax=Botrimarina sp. TaxID=2795802 RepID=UPI0032EF1E57
MTIDLTPDLAERVQRFSTAAGGCPEVEVIRRALDSLERQEEELLAIREGIEDLRAGRVQDFEEFDSEFRQRNSIPADG